MWRNGGERGSHEFARTYRVDLFPSSRPRGRSPMRIYDVGVIGAGPYGLTTAAHLRAAGLDVKVFGDVMSFWRAMPAGMLLRSARDAINLTDPARPLSLDDFERMVGKPLSTPIARSEFIQYGEWFQRQAVPEIDNRVVDHLGRIDGGFQFSLDDGESIFARRAVVATGLAPFTRRLPVFAGLPPDRVTHSLDDRDYSRYQGQQVLIVGSGQSALETAALLNEAGATVEIVTRCSRIYWLPLADHIGRESGPWAHLLYPPGAIGPPGINWIVQLPWLYRSLPLSLQHRVFRRAVRPAGSGWIRPRCAGVGETVGRTVTSAGLAGDRVRIGLDDGSERLVDHVVQGTGFAVDVARFGFLSAEIVRSLKTIGGQPKLGTGFESSVAGLHFLGAASDLSFGPLMRAIAGTQYAARSVTRAAVAGREGADNPAWARTMAVLELGGASSGAVPVLPVWATTAPE